jgi:hypothetical protein
MPRSPDELRERRRRERRRAVMRRRLGWGGVVVLVVAGGISVATSGGSSPQDAQASTAAVGAAGAAGGGAAAAPRAPAGSTVRITWVGDIMMGTPSFGLPPAGGRDLFTAVRPLLAGDVVIGNLEGTLTTRAGGKCGAGSTNCYAFQTPPSYVRNLKRAGFTVMNLANNHAYDFGAGGQADTVATLRRARILETGRPGTIVVQRAAGMRVAVLGFAPYRWANRIEDIPAAKRLVRRAAQQADLVVVTFHGGAEGNGAQRVRPGTETYLGENRGDSVAFSRAVIDAGADLVVGSGPHVLRGMQFHRGRLIAYSMGNFLGYRAFNLSGASGVSGVLRVTLRADGRYVNGKLVPTVLVGGGVPTPGGSAVSTVATLSRSDFGARAARLGADGTIRPPAG